MSSTDFIVPNKAGQERLMSCRFVGECRLAHLIDMKSFAMKTASLVSRN